jgi:tetratricopeptide (TPR) repeat protein
MLSYLLLSLRAQQLLWIMAFMQRDRITQEIFQRAALNIAAFTPSVPLSDSESKVYDYVKSFLSLFLDSTGDWDLDAFLSVISELLSYSLIELDQVNQTYVIHVLVQAWARTVTPHREAEARHTAYVLAAALNWSENFENYGFSWSWQLHVASVLHHCPDINSDVAACFGSVFILTGQWEKAPPLLTRVLQLRQQALGEEHPDTLAAMNNLASAYTNQGLLKQAEELQVRVADATKLVLGNEHPDTLVSMTNLATTYRKQGLLDQAKEMQVEILNTRKRVLGEDHPATTYSMIHVARTCFHQGLSKEAHDLQVQALDRIKKMFGEDHPRALTVMVDLANTYIQQGRLKEAEELQTKIVSARERVLGKEHIHTLEARRSLTDTRERLAGVGDSGWRSKFRKNK